MTVSPLRHRHVALRLNSRLAEPERQPRFDEPLANALASLELGRFLGGRAVVAGSGEAASHELDLDLRDDSPDAEARLLAILEELRSPLGSAAIFDAGAREVPFGTLEGVAIYLPAGGPGAAAAGNAIGALIRDFQTIVRGEIADFAQWFGERETALYLYGTSMAEAEASLRQFLRDHRLDGAARVERIA